MDYVEEIALEEPIQVPLEHLLFTVPDNWNLPTCFPGEAKPRAAETPPSHKEGDPTEEPTICYIEEEILDGVEVTTTSATSEFSREADHQEAQLG